MGSFTKRLISALLLMQLMAGFSFPVWAEGEEDPLWNRPSFEKKVINVGQQLLTANGITEKISFYSVTRDIRNASASRWGGPNTVVVYKDLLDVMESDDELAAVLAHEIAHIIKRHTGKIFPRRAVAKTALWTTYTVGGTAAILATGGLAAAPVMLAGAGVKRMARNGSELTGPISRPFEREADIVGLEYMVKAGYNPLAMETLMAKVVGDAGPVATFFSSHPVGTERLAYIHEEIVQKYPQFLTEEQQSNPLSSTQYALQGVQSAESPIETKQSDSIAADSAQTLESESKTALPWDEEKLGKPLSKAVSQEKQNSPQVLVKPVASEAKTGKNTSAVTSKDNQKAANQPKSVMTNKPEQSPVKETALIAPKTESVAATLLSLQPYHLRILRLISQRGYFSRKELKTQMEYLEGDTLTTALNELIQKKLVRVLGSEPDAVVVLTDWATDAFKPVLVESAP